MAEEQNFRMIRHNVGGLFFLLCMVAIVFVGGRMFVEQGANGPIDENLARYINEVAAHSAHAANYLKRYYARYSRETVAGVHFESVCAAVTAMAERDGFDPSLASPETAYMCRRFISRPRGEVPDL